jgi:predicted ATPase
VITGAPGAGKTALIGELSQRGHRTVAETARAILREPGGMELRETDPVGFAAAMIDREIRDLAAAPDDGRWTIFDRGWGDSLGFLRLSGIPVPHELAAAAATARYSGPIFLAPPWAAIFVQDAERTQDWEEAVASGAAVAAAWREAAYEPIELPRTSSSARADFIEAQLAD